MKLAHEAKRCGIESLEQEVEDIEETENVFKEGLRIILSTSDPAAIVNEILSNRIAHEKDKYVRLYMIIQKRAVLGLLAGESTYILYKVLSSLAGLTVKESWNLEALLLSGDDPEPEADESEDEDEGDWKDDEFVK
jgi:flagellar motor component MotA